MGLFVIEAKDMNEGGFLCMKKMNILIIGAIIVTVSVSDIIPALAKESNNKLNKSGITLTAGDSFRLKLSGAKKNVRWKSNKKNVASVDKKGVVKARKKGKAQVTAEYKKCKYICKVKVVNKKTGSKNHENDIQASGTQAPISIPALTPVPSVSPTSPAVTEAPVNTPASTPKVAADAWLYFSVDQTELTTDTTKITGKIQLECADTVIEVKSGGQLLGKTDIIETGKDEFAVNVDLSKCKTGDEITIQRKYVGEQKTGMKIWDVTKSIKIK